jgi:hypothetical protein
MDAATAGLGRGWTRVAEAVGQSMPHAEIARIWVFPPIRREDREWGTAVIAREAPPDRVRLYTGKYMLVTRGRERGQGRVEVEEVGETPTPVAHDVIWGVQHRLGEADPPTEIDPAAWYGDELDEPAAEG